MPYKIVRVSNNVYNVNNHDGSVPFKIIKRKDSDKNLQFSVINSENGKIHARHTSLKQAKAQIRLLQAIKGGGDRSRAVVPPYIGQILPPSKIFHKILSDTNRLSVGFFHIILHKKSTEK